MRVVKATVVWIGLGVVALGGGLGGCSGSLSKGDAGGGGTTGAGGGNFGQPTCDASVKKGGACAATDVQFCYKPCGPDNIGVKSETCASGFYAEMTGCVFDPGRDYSCYKLPAVANAACPAEVPQANAACSVAACLVCNSAGGTASATYLDSTGATQVGYCLCSASTLKWSCASDIAWPCPGGSGC